MLWRRMVREVPELMERSPKEARQRWLRLTGRLGNEEEQLSDGPPLDSFYLQVCCDANIITAREKVGEDRRVFLALWLNVASRICLA